MAKTAKRKFDVTTHRQVEGVSVPNAIPSGGRAEMEFMMSARRTEANKLLGLHFTFTSTTVTQVGPHGFHYKVKGEVIPKFVEWADARNGRFS